MRRRHSTAAGGLEAWALPALILGAFAACWLVATAGHLAHRLNTGDWGTAPWNGVSYVGKLAHGEIAWPEHATLVLIGLAVVLLAALAGAWWLLRRAFPASGPRAIAARVSAPAQYAALSRRRALEIAKRFGLETPGLLIGESLHGRRELWQDYESCSVELAGPRTGKTTGRVVPAILQAPGAVLTTSNKTDSLRATRAARAQRGRVWIFDPQALAGEAPAFWWNPVSAVTDETRAAALASVLAAAVTARNARSDAFFDTKAEQVVGALLLAAHAGGRTIDATHGWVLRPHLGEPVRLLRAAGYDPVADQLQAEIDAPEKQRGGVFGSAARILEFLANRRVLEWVTPGEGREEFDPAAFVRSSDTLYSLSMEGAASAGALVGALTVAVIDAAQEYAKESPRGRLPVPLVAVLDEAANVCKWPQLPSLYSHFGDRGIVLLTMLQSWSQGAEVWGEGGMTKLWSAANVRVVGAGVAESSFLRHVSELVGDWDRPVATLSRGRDGYSRSHATRRERLLDAADLAALEKGRVVVLASNARPVLAKLRPVYS